MTNLKKQHSAVTPFSVIADPFLFSEAERKCVVLAGLMHDLGHGIYSHLFDRIVIKSICESQSNTSLSSLENSLQGWQH